MFKRIIFFLILYSLVIIAAALYLLRAEITTYLASLAPLFRWWLIIMFAIVAFLALAAPLFIAYAYVSRQRDRITRPRDGSLPVREYYLQPLPRRVINWLLGRPSPRVLYNPNRDPGYANVLHDTLYTIEPRAGWDRQLEFAQRVQRTHDMQATAPGDDVYITAKLPPAGRSGGIPNIATGKLLTGALDPKGKKPQGWENKNNIEPAAENQAQLIPLDTALHHATPTSWALGQNPDNGTFVNFSPDTQHNIGIVGAQGTGKTASTGFHLLVLALRFGYHVVMLDPKSGVDLRPFAAYGEWHPTDAYSFGEQIRAVRAEHDRRWSILQQHGASNIDALGSRELGHVMVFLEEYGTLWEEIEARAKRTEVDAINGDIDHLMRMSRMTGIHFAFVDQFPEKWSKQVFMGAKFRLVYQVAPGQDAYLKEYQADQLPDRGIFQYRRHHYTAWHVEPQLTQLLSQVPTAAGPTIIEGVPHQVQGGSTSGGMGEGTPAGNASGNASVEGLDAELRDRVWAWCQAHPNGSQAQLRQDFAQLGIEISRTHAHRCWWSWPERQQNENVVDLGTEEGQRWLEQNREDIHVDGRPLPPQ